MKTLLHHLLVELFFVAFTEIFLGEVEWRLLILLFKKSSIDPINLELFSGQISNLLSPDIYIETFDLFVVRSALNTIHVNYNR